MDAFPQPATPLALDDWAKAAKAAADEVFGPLRGSLAEAVAWTSQVYTKERSDLEVASRWAALQARMRFYLVRDLPKLLGPMAELAWIGGLPEGPAWRVLDVGAGLGTTTFSMVAAVEALGLGPERIRVDAVDASEDALRGFGALARRAPVSAALEVRTLPGDALAGIERAEGPWDLIVMGLFLNELPFAEREALLAALAPRLAEGGTLLILEPALRETTRELHRLRDGLEGWTIAAPCLRSGPCPMLEGERDWCHEEEKVTLPPGLVAVAKEAGLRGDRLRYSYLTLRRDGRSLVDRTGEGAWRVVSQSLKTKGKLELFGCGTPGRVRFMRLDRHASETNAAFGDGRRGQVLTVTGAAERKSGKRVEKDTVVERLR